MRVHLSQLLLLQVQKQEVLLNSRVVISLVLIHVVQSLVHLGFNVLRNLFDEYSRVHYFEIIISHLNFTEPSI